MKFLKKNDVVDVVSLGTACTLSEIKKIENFILEIGLLPNIFFGLETTLKKAVNHEFPSFDAEIRFKQFKAAIENPDSKIIWCTRGGYGSAELLPFLKKIKKPKNKKILIGFSDISSLNKILIEEWEWEVISAPMLAQIVLDKVSKASAKAIVDLVFGKKTKLKYNLLTPYSLPLTPITGGCLSVLAGSFGTKNQIDWKNKILFLEDEGEDGERLDRYFSQLAQIMNEQKSFPKAILLGNFLEANPHGTPKAKNIEMAIEKFSKKISVPVLIEKSKKLGHSKNMLPLVLGAKAKIVGGVLEQNL
jgi:muramoyltetrapeptide carboxypeptidase